MDHFTLNMDVDAPTFVNFRNLDDSSGNPENYFTRNGHQTVIKQEILTPPTDQSFEDLEDNSGIYSSPSQYDNSLNSSDVYHGNSYQTKEQMRRRRSSSVPVLNRVKLTGTFNAVMDLSARLENCDISKNKSNVKLNKSAKFRSKDLVHDSSSKVKQLKLASKCEGRLNNKFRSTAELVRKYETDTPKRFHTVSSKKDAKVLLENMAKKPLLSSAKKTTTTPKSPNLRTKNRKRLITAISFEMREEMEYQQMKKYKMKAKAFNKEVLQGRITGCNVQKRPSTKPEPFKLTEIKRKPITQVTENFVFTAKPVPRSVIVGQEVKPRVPKKPSTLPVTPNILKHYKKNSSTNAEELKVIKEENSSSRNHPRKTIVQPFSFESKYQNAVKKREQKINQILEEEKRLREFHSKPMPVFKTPEKTKPVHNPVVAISPKFASKELVIEKQEKFKLKLEEEERSRKKAAEFKAKPCLVIYKQPFQPEFVDKPLTETEDFQLQCEIRAKQRQEFEAQCKLNQEKKLEELKRAEQLLKEKEAKQDVELRKMTIHKAQPIRKYKPMKSFEDISTPESPTLFSKHSSQRKDN